MRTSAMVWGVAAVALTLVGGGADTPAPRGEKIELKLNLKPGDKRKETVDMELKVDLKSQLPLADELGLDTSMTSSTICTTTYEVLDVDDQGVHTLRATLDRVRFRTSAGTLKIDYDSHNPSDNEGPRGLDALVGAPLKMKVSPQGQTLKVQGVDELAKNMPPNDRAKLKGWVEHMADAYYQRIPYLPNKPVDIGDTWSRTGEMAFAPNKASKLKATYTLYDRRDGVAIVKLEGKVDGGDGLPGTIQGTMRIDEKTGWAESGEVAIKLRGKVRDKETAAEGNCKFRSEALPASTE